MESDFVYVVTAGDYDSEEIITVARDLGGAKEAAEPECKSETEWEDWGEVKGNHVWNRSRNKYGSVQIERVELWKRTDKQKG